MRQYRYQEVVQILFMYKYSNFHIRRYLKLQCKNYANINVEKITQPLQRDCRYTFSKLHKEKRKREKKRKDRASLD